jgi:sortase (surface protein transpeptidase)
LDLPSIGVHTPLDRLEVDGQGQIVPPQDPNRAGWFAGGVRPGDPGPAVIAGHVDSRTGPAVFTRLGELRTGAVVVVADVGGVTVRFVVDGVKSYPKDMFPTGDVYGPTPDAQLRLITCGGAFDQATGHYVANVVVFAHRAG